MKRVILVLLITVAMVLTHGYAVASKGESPPEGSKLSGPDITGTMEFLPGPTGTFVGSCKNEDVNLSIPGELIPANLDLITVDTLEGYSLSLGGPGDVLPEKCAPPKTESTDVWLLKVVQLDKERDEIGVVTRVTAKVVWMFLVPTQ
jgi:hypothetical protein